MANLVSSSATLAFLTNMGDKLQSTAPSIIQVKNRQQTVRTEEKLDIIIQLEKGELIVDVCLSVVYTQFVIMLIEVLIR